MGASIVTPEATVTIWNTILRILKLKKMISYCNVDNVASIKVNDKLGYKFIKYIECKDITGKPITRKYYELVQDEFAKHD